MPERRRSSKRGERLARRPLRARTGQADAPAATGLDIRAVIEGISLVITPVTLLTALAFWFGWTMTLARAEFFGIDHSMLGFSTTDYLLRSADAAFVPVAVVLLIALAAVVGHRTIARQLEVVNRDLLWTRTVLVVLAVGLAALGAGVWGMFRKLWIDWYLLPPIILGASVAVTAYAIWVLRRLRTPDWKSPLWDRLSWILATMVTLLSIFWAASLYAGALGRGRAEWLSERLSARPAVTVLSEDDLLIAGPGITAEELTAAESPYHYRYTGLRLLIQSNGRVFLIPNGWTRDEGHVVVLDGLDGIRLELAPGGRS